MRNIVNNFLCWLISSCIIQLPKYLTQLDIQESGQIAYIFKGLSCYEFKSSSFVFWQPSLSVINILREQRRLQQAFQRNLDQCRYVQQASQQTHTFVSEWDYCFSYKVILLKANNILAYSLVFLPVLDVPLQYYTLRNIRTYY